jgi:hypothetical protein
MRTDLGLYQYYSINQVITLTAPTVVVLFTVSGVYIE